MFKPAGTKLVEWLVGDVSTALFTGWCGRDGIAWFHFWKCRVWRCRADARRLWSARWDWRGTWAKTQTHVLHCASHDLIYGALAARQSRRLLKPRDAAS